MPRIRYKGEAISIRLPVHLDDVFQAEARHRGMTARELAVVVIGEWVQTAIYAHTTSTEATAGRTHTPDGAASLVDEFFGQ